MPDPTSKGVTVLRMRSISSVIIIAAALLFVTPSYSSSGGRLIPVLKGSAGKGFIVTGKYMEAPRDDKLHRKILGYDSQSTRDILKRKRIKRGMLGAEAGEPDTIRTLLIRVSFETDREDELSSIHTGGDFDLRTGVNSLIDPPPHDKDYFDSHMTGLRNFLRFQSCGRVELEWKILPEGKNESYKLSDIADYGPGRGGYWTQERLVRFFRDCVKAADDALAQQGYPIRIGDFDAIVIAHAGADLQSDVNNDSPNDIPSFFALLGPEDQFTVDGGTTVITEGSVIPEVGSQDGYYSGVAAVLAHEFGHQLGLCDMYNVYNNSASVGVWDLMDSGGFLGAYIFDGNGDYHYVEGLVPGGFSAWSRYYLGWVDVDTVCAFREGIELPAVEKCPAKVVRIDVGNDEYFLLENRAAELDGYLTAFVADTNGVIIGTGNCLNCGDSIPADPVWELTNGYDILLPTESDYPSPDGGPGILIWHVDDRLIRERWEDNVVNSIKPFGIALVEADGANDLGDPYSRFSIGWYDDAFFDGNSTSLTDFTIPSSWSNWNVPTGVSVRNVSSRDTLMTFAAGIEGSFASSVFSAYMDDSDVVSFVALPGEHRVLAVDSKGNGWDIGTGTKAFSLTSPSVCPPAVASSFSNGDAVVIGELFGFIHAFSPDTWEEYEGWPVSLGSSLAAGPAIADSPYGCLVFAVDNVFRLHILNSSGEHIPGTPIILNEPIAGNLVVATDSLGIANGVFCFTLEGGPRYGGWLSRWDVYDEAGGLHIRLSSGYPVYLSLSEEEAGGGFFLLGGDIVPENEGDEVYVVCRQSGRIILVGSGRVIAERKRDESIASMPALGDVDNDGYLDLIFSSPSSVYVVTPSGANSNGWPRMLSSYCILLENVSSHIPPLFIASGSAKMVLSGTDQGLLYRMDSSGELYYDLPYRISGFFKPYFDISVIGQSASLVYMDGPRFKWRNVGMEGIELSSSWYSVYGNRERTAYLSTSKKLQLVDNEWEMLDSRFIVYPNPSDGREVKFHFPAPRSGLARLTIMTLTGERVLSREKRVDGDEDEFAVNLQDRASGIYICRLELIDAEGKRMQSVRKFAIVK